jgi:hypothetical protein
MSHADLIWNRACTANGCVEPWKGDRALAAMLSAHGLVMNGGVFHALELLNYTELHDARDGYRYFGFEKVAALLARARDLSDGGVDLENFEQQLDLDYASLIPSDSALTEKFELVLSRNPSEFAPL